MGMHIMNHGNSISLGDNEVSHRINRISQGNNIVMGKAQ